MRCKRVRRDPSCRRRDGGQVFGMAQALDQIQICNVRRTWAFSLDLGGWEQLRSCFHPNASIAVSWYRGPLDAFIERPKATVATHIPVEHRKHLLGNMRSEIRGTRAVL